MLTAVFSVACLSVSAFSHAQTAGHLSLGYLTPAPLVLQTQKLQMLEYSVSATTPTSPPQQANVNIGNFRILAPLTIARIDYPILSPVPLSLVTLGYAPNVVNPAANAVGLQPLGQTAAASYFSPTSNSLNLGLGLEAMNLVRNLRGNGSLGNLSSLSGIGNILNAGSLNIPGLPSLPTGR